MENTRILPPGPLPYSPVTSAEKFTVGDGLRQLIPDIRIAVVDADAFAID
jgi:hypothetical protein